MGVYFPTIPILIKFRIFGSTLEITVLLALELNSGKLDQHVYVFFAIFENANNMFSHASLVRIVALFLGAFLEAFGFLLALFWSLCRFFGVLVSSF